MKIDYKNIIPLRFQEASYKNDVSDEIKEIVTKQIRVREGVYFFGGSGVGKTHKVYAIVKDMINQGFDAMVYNTGDFLDKLRDEFNDDDDEEMSLFRKTMDFKGILVFDDIGSEKPSEWVKERLYLILNKRFEEMLPTLFTSNCDLGTLSNQLGDRITSRIAGMTVRVKIEGGDYRLKK